MLLITVSVIALGVSVVTLTCQSLLGRKVREPPSGRVKPKSRQKPVPPLAREEPVQALVFRWYSDRKFGFIKYQHRKVMILLSSFQDKPTTDIKDRWVEFVPSDVKKNDQEGKVDVVVKARLVTRSERRVARRKKAL